MTHNIFHRATWKSWISLCMVTAGVLPYQAQSQAKSIGDLADPFTLKNVRTGESFQLSDAAGSVIVLDFFNYW